MGVYVVYVFMHTSANAQVCKQWLHYLELLYSENKSRVDIFLDKPDLITHSLGESSDWNVLFKVSNIKNTLRMWAVLCF